MIAGKGVLFPLLAALCWMAFFYKLHDLRTRQRDPALFGLLVAFAVKGSGFLLATPRIAAAVDRRTGIPDLSALGIHLLGGVAFGAAVLVVLVYWSEPPDRAWRSARWRLAVAAAVMLTMFCLWIAVGLRTQERSTSYLVHNAHQPLGAVYLCLYVLTLLVALGEIARLCFRYAGCVGRPWLRRGLRTTAIGALIYSVDFWSRAFAIVGVRLGLDPLDWETLILLGAGIGMTLIILGLTMPSWGPQLAGLRRWWRTCLTCRTLHPLWRDLRGVSPAIVLHPRGRSITDANYRLYRRVIEIRDGLLALRPYRDATGAPQAGTPTGVTGDDRHAAAVAAELRTALRFHAAGRVVGRDSNRPTGDTETADSWTGKDLTSEAAWLARVARAYRRERG
jgi:hypothetical protein